MDGVLLTILLFLWFIRSFFSVQRSVSRYRERISRRLRLPYRSRSHDSAVPSFDPMLLRSSSRTIFSMYHLDCQCLRCRRLLEEDINIIDMESPADQIDERQRSNSF